MVSSIYIISQWLMLISSLIGIVGALVFVMVMAFTRTCRTLSILLVGNTALASLLMNTTTASQAIYMLLGSGGYPRILCSIRGYLIQSGTGLIYFGAVLQSLHRLFVTVFARHNWLKSKSLFLLLVVFQWTSALTLSLPMTPMTAVPYQETESICQGSMLDWKTILYLMGLLYFCPLIGLGVSYYAILRHVSGNTFAGRRSLERRDRWKKEIRTLIRIVLPVSVLLGLGLPYLGFLVYTQITQSIPSFAYHVSFIFITLGQGIVPWINIVLTDHVKKELTRLLIRTQRVYPVIASNVNQ